MLTPFQKKYHAKVLAEFGKGARGPNKRPRQGPSKSSREGSNKGPRERASKAQGKGPTRI